MAQDPDHQERLRNAGRAPESERPTWNKRTELGEAVITAVALISGATGLIVTESKDPPAWLVGLFAVLTIIPIAWWLCWAGRHVAKEASIARERYRWYRRLHEDYVRERQRSETATRALVAFQRLPGQIKPMIYTLSGAIIRDGDACLTIHEGAAVPRIEPGEILTVYDSLDGVWFGYIEATEERLPEGDIVTRFIDADALFLGYVHQTAELRRPIETRGHVVRVLPTDRRE